jgi:hypothetical protein
MPNVFDTLRNKIWPKPKPTPTPVPQPEPLSALDYVKAWRVLKNIPVHKLAPVVLSSGFVLFLAISGVLAWAAVLLRFMLDIIFMFNR